MESQFIQYLLVGNEKPVTKTIASRHKRSKSLLFYDEDEKRNRALRYASNQKSPFIDEQDEHAIPGPIVFEDGVLRVDKKDACLIQFLECSPENGVVYKKWEPELEEGTEERKAMLVLKAQVAITEASKACKIQAIKFAFPQINTEKHGDSRINTLALNAAKRSPEKVLEIVGNPLDARFDLEESEDPLMDTMKIAFKNQYVQTRNNDTEIYYNLKDNKKRIAIVPTGEKVYDVFYEWLKTEDGIKLCRHIQRSELNAEAHKTEE